jgi:type I restriction enzyme, S subunit
MRLKKTYWGLVMQSEWRNTFLGELVDVKQGLAINAKSKHLLVEDGMPLLRITDLLNNVQVQFINAEEAPVQCIANEEDLIYTRTGQVGYIFRRKVGVVHNNCFRIIPKDDTTTRGYLYWFLSQDKIRKYANDISSGSVQKDLNHSAFKSIPITIPSPETQYKIEIILNAIEDKIELNRKMNQTLEEMAQALFKSWFVDFDPVHAKANCSSDEELELATKELGIAKDVLELFPSEFEESELGMIPKEWTIGYFGDKNFSKIIGSGIKTFDNEKIYLATADVTDTNITNTSTMITYENRASRANMQPIEGSVWFAKMQNSRKLLMFDDYSSSIDDWILSTGFAGIKTTELSHCFIWAYIMSDSFNVIKDNLADGAVQIAINNTSIKKINYTKPTENLLELFNSKVTGLFNKKYNNDLEIESLQQTRDTLLPKLLSGELDVSELELDMD